MEWNNRSIAKTSMQRSNRELHILKFVIHQEADIGLVPVAISLQRYEALVFRGRIGGDWTSILVRYPLPYVSFTSTLDLFSKEVI